MTAAVQRLSAWIDRFARGAAGIGLILMLGLVMAQIVTRYLLNDPPAWLDEAARTAMVWTALLGATAAFRAGLDPKVMDRWATGHPRLDALIGAGRTAAVLLFVGAVLLGSPGFMMRHGVRVTDALEWNSAIVVAIVPLFALILLVHLAAQLAAGRSAGARGADTPGAQ